MLKFLRRISRILLFIVAILLVINLLPPTDAIAINPFMKSGNTVLVASDSGCGTLYPHNVMASFNAASSFGVMYFSLGLVMTSDEQLIIADQDDLGVYTNTAGKISEATYDSIKDLNFAYQFKDASGAYPYQSQILRCVTIEQLFDSFPYSNFIIKINMEGEKAERAAVLLCEQIRLSQLSTRIVVKGEPNILEYVREQTNVNVLSAPVQNEINRYDSFRKIFISNLYRNVDFQYVEISTQDVNFFTKGLIKSLQKRNISVFMNDVNTEEDYQTALKVGVDGVISDNPDLILKLIATDGSDIDNTENNDKNK